MKRKKLLRAVDSTADTAADSNRAVLDEAVHRITPLVEQAGDYVDGARKRGIEFATDAYDRVQPHLDTARKRGSALAADAYERLEPALKDAGKFAADTYESRIHPALHEAKKRGAKAAAEALDRVHPALDDALDRVTPAVDSAVKKVRPVVDDTLERVAPSVDAARDRLQNDFLPWLVAALYKAADLVSDEVVEPARKKRGVGKTLGLIALAGAVLAGVFYAVRRLVAPPESSWETHEPSRPYVADPVADVVNKVKDSASNLVDEAKAAAAGAAAAASDVVDDLKDRVGDAGDDVEAAVDKAGDAAEATAADVTETVTTAADDLADRTDEVADDATALTEDVQDATERAADDLGEAADHTADAAPTDTDAQKGDASPLAESSYGEGSYVGAEPPEDYVIKGNERSMKYHVQGSGGYERTITDVWFNSTEAAERAGFVRAQR